MSDDLSPEEQAIYDAELAVAELLTAEAMTPYRKLLSAEKLEEMHEMLIEVLMTHPEAGAYIEALAKRAAPEISADAGPADAAKPERAGGSDKA